MPGEGTRHFDALMVSRRPRCYKHAAPDGARGVVWWSSHNWTSLEGGKVGAHGKGRAPGEGDAGFYEHAAPEGTYRAGAVGSCFALLAVKPFTLGPAQVIASSTELATPGAKAPSPLSALPAHSIISPRARSLWRSDMAPAFAKQVSL